MKKVGVYLLAGITAVMLIGQAGYAKVSIPQNKSKMATSEKKTQKGQEEIINNGSEFVKCGNYVYYREYGKDALEKVALWGEYRANPTGKGKSRIVCFDEQTQRRISAFPDDGYGKLYMGDGCFYFNKLTADKKHTFYSVALDGTNKKALGKGEILGFSKEANALIIRNEQSEKGNGFEIWKDGKLKETVTSQTQAYLVQQVVGKYLFYSEYAMNENKPIKVWCKDLSKKAVAAVMVGTLPANELGDSPYICQVEMKDERAWISYEYLEGSGQYFYGGKIAICDVNHSNSLISVKNVAPSDLPDPDISRMPAFWLDDKEGIKCAVKKPNEAWSKENSIYTTKKDGKPRLVIKGLYPIDKEGGTQIEVVERVGRSIFVVMNVGKYNKEGSIGWRDAYERIQTQYLKIDVESGQVTVLGRI